MNKQAFDKLAIGANALRMAKSLRALAAKGDVAVGQSIPALKPLARQLAKVKSDAGWLAGSEGNVFRDMRLTDNPIRLNGKSINQLMNSNPAAKGFGWSQTRTPANVGETYADSVRHRYKEMLLNKRLRQDSGLQDKLLGLERKQRLVRGYADDADDMRWLVRSKLPKTRLQSYVKRFTDPAATRMADLQSTGNSLFENQRELHNARTRLLDGATSSAMASPQIKQRLSQIAKKMALRHRQTLSENPQQLLAVNTDQLQSQVRNNANTAKARTAIVGTDGLPAGDGLRFKGFTDQDVLSIPKNKPMWYSPHSDVSAGYAHGSGPVAVTTENTLKSFGRLGPTTPHIATDARGFGSVRSWLARRNGQQAGSNTDWGSRLDYEQVATKPDNATWLRSHNFFVPGNNNQFKPISARGLFGVDATGK